MSDEKRAVAGSPAGFTDTTDAGGMVDNTGRVMGTAGAPSPGRGTTDSGGTAGAAKGSRAGEAGAGVVEEASVKLAEVNPNPSLRIGVKLGATPSEGLTRAAPPNPAQEGVGAGAGRAAPPNVGSANGAPATGGLLEYLEESEAPVPSRDAGGVGWDAIAAGTHSTVGRGVTATAPSAGCALPRRTRGAGAHRDQGGVCSLGQVRRQAMGANGNSKSVSRSTQEAANFYAHNAIAMR